MSWHLGPKLAYDTETTGVDLETVRIVSAAAIHMDNGAADTTEWLADPGVEIPAEVTAVHGITTERARAEGRPATEVIVEIVEALAAAVAAGTPIVGHNVVFDLTLTDRETRRHLGLGLWEALGGEPYVIDTMVLDRYTAPFRKRVSEKQGPYQMRTTAETYGLGWDEAAAHGAAYDALMSGRVAWHMGRIAHQPRGERPGWVRVLRTSRHNHLAGLTLDQMHARQVQWAAADAASYQAWLRNPAKSGDKHDAAAVIDGTWPLRPVPAVEEASA